MNDTDLTKLLQEANDKVPTLTFDETMQIISSDKCIIIDVREESEVEASGLIKGAINISSVKRDIKQLLPTPLSPMRANLKR